MWFHAFRFPMEGGKLAWLDPVNKRILSRRIVSPEASRGAKCVDMTPPDFIVTHLVGLGNDTNADAAETNHLQTYRASETAECSWNRKKRQESWTIESLGQGTCENLKIEHVNSSLGDPLRLLAVGKSSATKKRCWGFSRDSQKVKVVSGKTSWAAYDERCMKACDFKKLQASTDKNYIARLFRNNFVTMASIGWTHPHLALEVFKCFVPRRKEFRDLMSLLKGGLPVVKTIEEHQLFGLLAPVNNSNVDRDNAKEMLKRQRALQKAAKDAATGKKRGPTMLATMAVVEDGTLEERLASRLWRLMDCLRCHACCWIDSGA